MARISMFAFLIVGCAILGFGLFKLASNAIFWAQADSTEGKVLGTAKVEATRNYGATLQGAPTHAAVVRFTAADGTEYTHIPDVSSEAAVDEVGTNVRILYDAKNPNRAIIADFYNMFLGPLLVAFFGAVFGIVGMVGLLFAKFLDSRSKERASRQHRN